MPHYSDWPLAEIPWDLASCLNEWQYQEYQRAMLDRYDDWPPPSWRTQRDKVGFSRWIQWIEHSERLERRQQEIAHKTKTEYEPPDKLSWKTLLASISLPLGTLTGWDHFTNLYDASACVVPLDFASRTTLRQEIEGWPLNRADIPSE